MPERAAWIAGNLIKPRRAAARRVAAMTALALAAAGCAPPATAARAAPPRAADGAGAGAGAASAAQRLREAESLAGHYRVIGVQLFVLDEASAADAQDERGAARRAALEAEAARVLERTVAAYTALVDAPALRRAEQRPRALLGLARALQDRGEARGAEARLRQLVEDHPDASEAPEAYLALANLAFAAGRLDAAARACDGALQRGAGAALRKRALYVKSWSLRGLGGRGATLSAMAALREIVQLGPAGEGSPEATIDAAAERELVELYAAHGDLDEAGAFFAGAGDHAGPRLLAEVRARAARQRRPPPLDRPML
ncbi:tetratricopeptide repeat protein [Sorangium sp. So ce1036]|uniref:hypothetical protein n=1 Tax=Sorangium sp. So ce1036 TaxID=3133328 RepID=UPI003F092134